jgi:hypothetical protein
MAVRITLALAAGFVLVGCGGDINNKEAIRQGIVDHLAARKGLDLDLSSMDIDVASVTFRGNEADADVAFKARGSQQSLMQMKYTLEREGNRWKVKAKKDTGTPHGGAAQEGASPHPMPAPQGGEALPPGHPPLEPGASGTKAPGSRAPEKK